MEKYSSYKDSGFAWMGQIPSHWETRRFRFLLAENSLLNTDLKERKQLQFKYGDIVPKANQSEDKDVLDTIKKYTVVAPGDIMINGLNLNYDFISQRVAQVQEPGVITSAYVSLRPLEGANSKYYTYYMKAMDAQKMFHGMGSGVRLTLSYDNLKNLFFPYPSPEEQEAIVAYLDAATAKIDEAIAQQQLMINSLNERTLILIQEYTTKGLQGKTPMRDSGSAWIGMIPSHWDVVMLKRKATIILGKMLNRQSSDRGNYYLCAKDVHFDGIDVSDLKRMLFTHEEKHHYLVKQGDMLIVEGGAGAGGCAIVKEPLEDVYIQNSIMIVRGKEMNNGFISYFMQGIVRKGYIDCICNKATIPHFTKDKVSATPIPVPPIDEQDAIVKQLDMRLSYIKASIEYHNSMIELLQERKQIIINDVVTGKVKVV